MKRLNLSRSTLSVCAAAIMFAACSGSQGPIGGLPNAATGGSPGSVEVVRNTANARQVCPAVGLRSGYVRCFAWIRTDINDAMRPDFSLYGPSDLQTAYNLPSSTKGFGQTVAIVDAFGYSNAESDLGHYRSYYNLPACTTANGCFKKVDQNGGQNYPKDNVVWDQEQALDIDMVSAICPNCHIVLVEANVNNFKNMHVAEKQAFKQGAGQVSNSYGGHEFSKANLSYTHKGVVITAGSGDNGYGIPQEPCSWATVVCVGGTTLTKVSPRTESSWNRAGSGCSAFVIKPKWQTDKGCTMRSESDVSATANPLFPVAVYYGGAFLGFGGTSVGSPIIASVFALAGNHATQRAAKGIWAAGGGPNLNDITSGSPNGKCPIQYLYICTPGPGYDGETGWGSPNGIAAF